VSGDKSPDIISLGVHRYVERRDSPVAKKTLFSLFTEPKYKNRYLRSFAYLLDNYYFVFFSLFCGLGIFNIPRRIQIFNSLVLTCSSTFSIKAESGIEPRSPSLRLLRLTVFSSCSFSPTTIIYGIFSSCASRIL